MNTHELITKYFEGLLSEEEKNILFKQIKNDPEIAKEFSSLQNLYGLSSWLPEKNDKAKAIGKLLTFKQNQKKKRNTISYKHLLGYAAAVFISVLISSLFFTYTGMRDRMIAERFAELEEEAQITYEEFTAPPGQRALVKLHDGTTVWLNARTTLRYPNHFAKKERRVELNGEAYFDVKENHEQPFIVSTEKLNVKVTGTSFNVFAYHGQPEFSVSLLEGHVTAYLPNEELKGIVLLPNERATLKGNNLIKQPFTQMDFLLWKDGIYAFDDIPFNAIIKKLELYYDVTIAVNNPQLKDYKFSGKFRQRDGVESVLRALRKIQYFSYTKNEETNIITIE